MYLQCDACEVAYPAIQMREVSHREGDAVIEGVMCQKCFERLVERTEHLGWRDDILSVRFAAPHNDDPLIKFRQLIADARVELVRIIASPTTTRSEKLRAMNNRHWLENLRFE